MNENDFENKKDNSIRSGFGWKEGGPEKELTPEMFRRFAIKYGAENEKDIDFLWKTRPVSLESLVKENNNYDKSQIDSAIKDMVSEFKQFNKILIGKGLDRHDVESLWVTRPEHRLTDVEIATLADDYINILESHKQKGKVEEEEEKIAA